MHPKKIGLIANSSKPGAVPLVRALREEFASRGLALHFEVETARLAGVAPGVMIQQLAEMCDLLVVLGGDGTILRAVHSYRGDGPPIFGINIGSLGFLTCVAGDEYQRAIESIVSGKYSLSGRALLQVSVERNGEPLFTARALNDAVISRGETSRLIRLRVRINGDSLTEYNADGLIVSTPTGSTAYSLSAGGPVITPDSGVLMLTPICPHVLTNRSVIVGDGALIEIKAAPTEAAVFLTLDGQEAQRIEPDDLIRITKSAHRLRLASPGDTSFFGVLREKLKWSGAAIE